MGSDVAFAPLLLHESDTRLLVCRSDAMVRTAQEAQAMAAKYARVSAESGSGSSSTRKRRAEEPVTRDWLDEELQEDLEGGGPDAEEKPFGWRPPVRSSLLAKAESSREKFAKREEQFEKQGAALMPVKGADGSVFTRDEKMQINQDIPLGPEEFWPPEEDPEWEMTEPYSQIALE